MWFIFLIVIHDRSKYLITMSLPKLIFLYTVLPVVVPNSVIGADICAFPYVLTQKLYSLAQIIQFSYNTFTRMLNWVAVTHMGVWTGRFRAKPIYMRVYIYMVYMCELIFYVALYRKREIEQMK